MQIGGPTGAFIVVVYGVIERRFRWTVARHDHGRCHPGRCGLAWAGRIIALIPEAVIEGFTIGIALIIAVSQLKDLFGLDLARLSADFVEAVPHVARATLGRDRGTVVGMGSIVGIALFSRAGSLIVVALASAAVALMHLPVETIHSRFGALPDGLPYPSLPPFTLQQMADSALGHGDRLLGGC